MTAADDRGAGTVEVRPRQRCDRVGPLLSGRRVRLEPLARRHLPALLGILQQPGMVDEWPQRGTAIDGATIEDRLWRMSNRQYAVVSQRDGAVVGLVQAIDVDEFHATAGLSLFTGPQVWGSGWPIEGLVLFIQLMFEAGYGRLCCRMAEGAHRRLSAAKTLGLTEEAVFRDHISTADGFEDLHALAIEIGAWDWAWVARWLRLDPTVGSIDRHLEGV